MSRLITPLTRDHEGAPEAHTSIDALIARQVARSPLATAVVFGDERLGFAELDRRADAIARRLLRLGVRRGELVAVALERSVELVASLLGVLKVGAAYLPLDASLPLERWRFLLEDAAPRALIARADVALPSRHAVELDPRRELLGDEDAATAASSADDRAYVIYTSGSTGTPKGVVVRHGSVANLLGWMRDTFALGPTDRVLHKTPFFWDVSVPEIFGTLMAGATIVIAAPGRHGDMDYLCDLIDREGVTTASFVPSVLGHFADAVRRHPVPSLRRVLVAGEALTFEAQERFFASSDAELHNLYGPTEGTVYATHWVCRRGGASRTVPIGRPIGGVEARVLDEQQRPVPAGVQGELYLGGACLAEGYLRREALTAARFPTEGTTGARLYRTGDLVRHDERGELEFFGRLDDQIKLHGNRVELGEVESALGEHPAVREAAAVASAGNTALVAYVVPRESGAIDPEVLRAFVAAKLPSYMVPVAIHVVDALPRTPSGKLDRRALRPPTQPRDRQAPHPYEAELASLWLECTGRSVGPHDNFFEVGGDSIQATAMCAKVAAWIGAPVRPSLLLRAPTLRGFATALREPATLGNSPLVPIRLGGDGAPLVLLHGMGGGLLGYRALLSHLGADRPIYGVQAIDRDGGPLLYGRIEEIAAYYVGELLRAHPTGPYVLGGGSFGGNVAFEMSRLLEARGKVVALIALFDAGLGAAGMSRPVFYGRRAIVAANKLWFHAREAWKRSPGERADYLRARWKGLRERVFTARWERRFERFERGEAALPEAWRDPRHAHWLAINRYRPAARVGASTVLYRATLGNQLWVLGNDETYGWGPYAPRLEIIPVEGGHSEVIEEPHAAVIAADLTRRMRAA